MKNFNVKDVKFKILVLFLLFFLTCLLVIVMSPVVLKMTVANSYPVPSNPRTPYIQEMYDTLVSDGYGSDAPGAWGDYGAVWNRIRSASLMDPVVPGSLWLDRQQQEVLNAQAYADDADYAFAGNPSYRKISSSHWGKIYDDVPGEIWKDYRTDLYWSDVRSPSTTNDFDIGVCDFYNYDNRGDYDGSDINCGDAINLCANLSLGGISNWYLPSKAELLQAYLDGIFIQTGSAFTTTDFFWSSTEISMSAVRAWHVDLSTAETLARVGVGDYVRYLKTYELPVRCVYRDSTVPSGIDQGGGYALQSLMKWEDHKATQSGYESLVQPFTSYWSQVSTDPEIWKDHRAGLYWTEFFDNWDDVNGFDWWFDNEFDSDLCPFFHMPRGSFEYAGYDPSDWPSPNNCGQAIDYCAYLNTVNGGSGYGGMKGWYLPSLDDYVQGYINGMYINTSPSFLIFDNVSYWAATRSGSDADVFLVRPANGIFYEVNPDSVSYARCVSRE